MMIRLASACLLCVTLFAYAAPLETPRDDLYTREDAGVIVSRGCFFFWEDKAQAFGEFYRVLKPGGVAYIGRGMARDFHLEKAQAIRAKQKGNKVLKYDPEETAEELFTALEKAGISDFTLECPKPEGDSDIHYGVWVTIRKGTS